MSRPNLVLFMPDQLRSDAIGCFGQGAARTPNIDALAADGIRFPNAYANHPVCGPSRVSFMTGWYPHVHGHRTLTNLLQPQDPNLLRYLKDAGYTVAWAGMRGDTFAPGVTEQSTNFAGFLTPMAHGISAFSQLDHPLAEAYYDGKRPPIEGGVPYVDFDEASIRTVEEILADPPPEPWCMFVALIFPHVPFQVEDPWYSLHDPAGMPAPSGVSTTRKPGFQADLRQRHGFEAFSSADWAEITRTYYGMVSRVDDQLGRVRDAVERAGASGRTGWVFFTDHGEYLGDHGLVEKWPSGLDDCLLRNPLIISLPDGPRGAVNDSFVELVDLMPTLLDVAETEAGHTHFGRSLLPLLNGETEIHRDVAFSEGGFSPADNDLFEDVMEGRYATKTRLQREQPELVSKATSVRTAEWTYIHRQSEPDELYSRTNDPQEHENVLDEHPKVVAEHRELMLDWLVETSDVIRWDKDPRFTRIDPGWRP